MTLVIPSLIMRNGKCTLFIKSDENSISLYKHLSENPLHLCRLWRKENARTIHITDYDSNETTMYSNMDAIIFLASEFDIPFQVLANFRSIDECKYLLDNGIYRIFFGEFAYAYPDEVRKLINRYTPNRISGFIDSFNYKIQFSEFSNVLNYEEMIEFLVDLGIERIIFKEQNWIDNPGTADFDLLSSLAKKFNIKITLFESIYDSKQLWHLNTFFCKGIDSWIAGPSLYDNNFHCQELWRRIESKLEK